MELMIQRITMEFVKNFCEHFSEQGIYDLGEMMGDGKQMAEGFVKDLIGAVIQSADDALVRAKSERRADGIIIQERDVQRTQFTSLGPFTYKRTYFDTPSGMEYLLDDILGVNAYERIDTTISANMANKSAEMSFGRSSDIATGGMVSRQTAWKKTMGTGEAYLVPGRANNTPEVIHIFADEDHVHLQDGGSTILPLVTVCAGKNPVCKGRNELIDPIHIGGYALKPSELWEYVYAVCATKYDMDKVRKVIVYGDAAKWIAGSKDVFAYSVSVLDDYHFRKHLKALTAGTICATFAPHVHKALKEDKKDIFQKLVYAMEDAVQDGMEEGPEKKKRLRHIIEEGAFLFAHWDEVQNIRDKDSIGSCTEALVSHVFSERFSRNPMGWSRAGLEKMSMLRVFVKNGGRIMPIDIGVDKRTSEERKIVKSRVEKYATLANGLEAEILGMAKNWRWFDHEDDMIPQARTGTRHALRLLGKMRDMS